MKKLILALSITALSFTVSAAEEKPEDTLKLCKSISTLAGEIMKSRQAGVTMADMYEVATGKLSQTMVEMAFDRPLFGTGKYQDQEVLKFKNVWFKECIKKRK